MNRAEWLQCGAPKTDQRKRINKMLAEWKISNNIECRCVVHHRDDTEECRKYNEEHYELWGFNLDGTFEYGKYVVFMTLAEHNTYHKTGDKNHNYGKHPCEAWSKGISDANRKRVGVNNPNYGKRFSEEHRKKMSLNNGSRSLSRMYARYKSSGGELKWKQFLRSYKELREYSNGPKYFDFDADADEGINVNAVEDTLSEVAPF